MKKRVFIFCSVVAFFLGYAFCESLLATVPRVVVSIPPIHSLVSQIMEGVGTPELLFAPEQSPHVFHPSPSDMQRLHEADVVFWIGPGMENGLVRSLESRSGLTISLIRAQGLKLYGLRTNDDFEVHDHRTCGGHAHAHEGEEHEAQPGHADHHESEGITIDAHIWLDPDNAMVLLKSIQDTLIQLDSSNTKIYKENYARASSSLRALKQELEKETQEIKSEPFLVFHDGYQYFEKAFCLKGVGSFMLDVEAQPSLKRVELLAQKARRTKVRCLFAEPQYNRQALIHLAQNLGVKVGVLDYMGVGVPLGGDAYGKIMRGLSKSLRECLHD